MSAAMMVNQMSNRLFVIQIKMFFIPFGLVLIRFTMIYTQARLIPDKLQQNKRPQWNIPFSGRNR